MCWSDLRSPESRLEVRRPCAILLLILSLRVLVCDTNIITGGSGLRQSR